MIAKARSISGLVAEYIVVIDVTRVRFPADATLSLVLLWSMAPYLLSLALKALSVKAQNTNEHKPSQRAQINKHEKVRNIISPPSSVGRAQGP